MQKPNARNRGLCDDNCRLLQCLTFLYSQLPSVKAFYQASLSNMKFHELTPGVLCLGDVGWDGIFRRPLLFFFLCRRRGSSPSSLFGIIWATVSAIILRAWISCYRLRSRFVLYWFMACRRCLSAERTTTPMHHTSLKKNITSMPMLSLRRRTKTPSLEYWRQWQQGTQLPGTWLLKGSPIFLWKGW